MKSSGVVCVIDKTDLNEKRHWGREGPKGEEVVVLPAAALPLLTFCCAAVWFGCARFYPTRVAAVRGVSPGPQSSDLPSAQLQPSRKS